MSDVNSPMYNRTSVYVSDNGQTLQLNNNRLISVFHNENLGGAGGFTRCLIEAKMSKEPYTHFVFMDDDIILDTHAIEKLIALLTTLKKTSMVMQLEVLCSLQTTSISNLRVPQNGKMSDLFLTDVMLTCV